MAGRDTAGKYPPAPRTSPSSSSTGSGSGVSGPSSAATCNDTTVAVTVTAVRDPLDRFVSGYNEVVDRCVPVLILVPMRMHGHRCVFNRVLGWLAGCANVVVPMWSCADVPPF